MIYIPSLIFWGFAIAAHFCEKTIPVMTVCLGLPASTRYDNIKPKMVGITIGATVHLECNFCNVEDNYEAKIWFFKKRGSNEQIAEINLPMDSNPTGCRVSMRSSHRLDLQNFDLGDSGIYECKHTYLDNALTFTYILDAVFDNNTTMKINGKNCPWKDNGPYINLINKNFLESNDDPFLTLRRNNNFTFQITIIWDGWGPCEYQGKQGIRHKQGLCQVYPIPYENCYQTISDNSDKIDLKDNYVFLCHSLSFNKSFPELSIILRDISRFEIAEPCHPSTIVTKSTQHRIPKQTLFKYKTTKYIVGENSHLTLLCPEVVPEATVEWHKDSKLLGSSFRNNMAEFEDEPHITIDSCNALYILHATKNEEALYACYVDGVTMQMFDVKVVSKSKLLNEGFIRYSIYLGFVLSLTLTCYCAGICVAWHRRSSFADPFYHKVNRRSDKSIHFKDYQEMQSLLP